MIGTEQLDLNGRPRSSYYSILGISPRASDAEIRSAYRKLALKWHPDRRGREPWLVEEAKRKFQLIQEAYQVLSDKKRRALYDAGLYDPFEDDQEEVEGMHDFIKEMLSLMDTIKREEPVYSMQELQQMFSEMVQSFATPPHQSMSSPSYWYGTSNAPHHQSTSSSYWYGTGTGTGRNVKRHRTQMGPAQVLRSH